MFIQYMKMKKIFNGSILALKILTVIKTRAIFKEYG